MNHVKTIMQRMAGAFLAGLVIVSTLGVALHPSTAQAALDVPQVILYQGRLTDENRVTVDDGTYDMIFTIWDNASTSSCTASGSGGDFYYVSGGTCASPVATSVTVTDGMFTVALGDDTAAFGDELFDDAANSTYYLEITIEGETLSPRRVIGSTAFAIQAGDSHLLDDKAASASGCTAACIPATDSNGNLLITGDPQGSSTGQGSLYINPAAADTNDVLFGIADNGTARFSIDKEGDASLTGTLAVTSGTSVGVQQTRSSAGQWFSFADGTDTFGLYNRAGTPEGSVTANIGSLALDTSNGALYVKTSDSANTGWSLLTTGGSIYSADGTLAGDRTVTLDAHTLTLSGTGDIVFSDAGGITADGSLTVGDASGDSLILNAGTASSANALTWTLKDNTTSALTFGSTGASDIFKINTTDGHELVQIQNGAASANTAALNVTVASSNTNIAAGYFAVTLDDDADSTDNVTGLRIVATQNSNDSDNLYGLMVSALGGAASSGNEYGIYVGSGWDVPYSAGRSGAGQWLTFGDGTDSFGLYNNAGSPESAVTADKGSLALDTTNGALYVKTTDSANTGWSLVTTGGNLYSTSGTLAGDRTIATGGHTLTIDGTTGSDTVFNDNGTASIGGALTVYGNAVPSSDDAFDLGTDDVRWQDIYVDGSKGIHIGDSGDEAGSTESTITKDGNDYLVFNSDEGFTFNSDSDNPGVSSVTLAPNLPLQAFLSGTSPGYGQWIAMNPSVDNDGEKTDNTYASYFNLDRTGTVTDYDSGGGSGGPYNAVTSTGLYLDFNAAETTALAGVGLVHKGLEIDFADTSSNSGDASNETNIGAHIRVSSNSSDGRVHGLEIDIDSSISGQGSDTGKSASAIAISRGGIWIEGDGDPFFDTASAVTGMGGDGTIFTESDIEVHDGALCVGDADNSNGGTDCSGDLADGRIYSISSSVIAHDLAEMFPSAQTLMAGDIVSASTAGNEFVERAQDGSLLLGIISTQPGVILGHETEADGYYPVALAGRVPVRVNNEGGAIAIGDRIALSRVPGVGKKATEAGQVIGIAMQPATFTQSSTDAVVVFVQAQPWDGRASTGSSVTDEEVSFLVDTSSVLSMDGTEFTNIASLAGYHWSIDGSGRFLTTESYDVEIRSSQNERVQTHAVLGLEHYITLAGVTDVENGLATIDFEQIAPAFNDIIDPSAPMIVTATPSNGAGVVYITDKSAQGFRIHLQSGAFATQVDWMVMAYRLDHPPEEPDEALEAPEAAVASSTEEDVAEDQNDAQTSPPEEVVVGEVVEGTAQADEPVAEPQETGGEVEAPAEASVEEEQPPEQVVDAPQEVQDEPAPSEEVVAPVSEETVL